MEETTTTTTTNTDTTSRQDTAPETSIETITTEAVAVSTEQDDDDVEATKKILSTFFHAINTNDVNLALDCCSSHISVTYPDFGRNWIGKERGRVVMTAIFGQLLRINKQATYEIVEILRRGESSHDDCNDHGDSNDDCCKCRIIQIKTKETWGHDHIISKTTYTFDSNHKILSMES